MAFVYRNVNIFHKINLPQKILKKYSKHKWYKWYKLRFSLFTLEEQKLFEHEFFLQ